MVTMLAQMHAVARPFDVGVCVGRASGTPRRTAAAYTGLKARNAKVQTA